MENHNLQAIESLEQARNSIISNYVAVHNCTCFQTNCENEVVALPDISGMVSYKKLSVIIFPNSSHQRFEQHFCIVSVSSGILMSDDDLKARVRKTLSISNDFKVKIARYDEK